MQILTVPSIFWTTLLSVAAILSLANWIGRAWGGLFPYRLRGAARFYLAPVLGLATLTIIASLLDKLRIANTLTPADVAELPFNTMREW